MDFRSKIETVGRIINLLGMNFTIYVSMQETIKSILTSDLLPYGVGCKEFMKASNLIFKFKTLFPNSDRVLKITY